jgi:SAM-dependent methyltransferase
LIPTVPRLHQRPLAHALCSGILAEVQSAICEAVARLPRPAGGARLLDIGCWDGEASVRYGSACRATGLSGIEIFEQPANEAESRGLDVARIDLEREPFPWEIGSFDIVVCNQVFEHLKNIWLPLSEAFHVLKPGGHLVISVPNLASFHNRVLLAVGRQPTSIRTLGPHVRGYTLSELTDLLELGGGFEVQRVTGVGFYPFSATLARRIARTFAGASHTPVVIARKVRDLEVSPWEEYRQSEISGRVQTFYSA